MIRPLLIRWPSGSFSFERTPVVGGTSDPLTFETISTAAHAANTSNIIDNKLAVEVFDLTQPIKGV